MARLRTAAVAVLGMAMALVTSTVGMVDAAPRPYGDAVVIAQVPTPPGFPEGVAVNGSLVWVSGPATFGTAGGPPSKLLVFRGGTGKLLKTFDAVGEDLTQDHAYSSVALDRALNAYVLNVPLGVLRVSLTGKQTNYTPPFPDLPPCSEAPPGADCSPTPFDAPALINDLAFAPDGSLYITDSFQATIWRVPPGGGAPQIWFQDIRLATTFVGPNGIRLSPDRSHVYVSVSGDLEGRAWVYRLPLVAAPTGADLEPFHEYTGGDFPDGFAFGETGLLYVTIATPFASGISILDTDGNEVDRLTSGPDPLFPYDSPSTLAFNGRGSALVSNHAFATGGANPEQFTILDVWLADRGDPLVRPIVP